MCKPFSFHGATFHKRCDGEYLDGSQRKKVSISYALLDISEVLKTFDHWDPLIKNCDYHSESVWKKTVSEVKKVKVEDSYKTILEMPKAKSRIILCEHVYYSLKNHYFSWSCIDLWRVKQIEIFENSNYEPEIITVDIACRMCDHLLLINH